MIRVLHMLGSMNYGGQETFIMNIYRKIDRSLIQFDFIVYTDKKCDYDDEIKCLGGIIYRVPVRRTSRWKDYNQIRNIVKSNGYSIIHAHTASARVALILIAAKFGGANIIIAHSHNTSTPNHKLSHKLMRPLLNCISTNRYACSADAGKWLFYKKDYSIIQNGIDTSKFAFNSTVRKKKRAELNLENSFIIGHIGRFCSQKNHEFLIDIFKAVYDKDKKSVLLLVGEGELRNAIEKKVNALGLSHNVVFMGARSDISDLLHVMDVFIFPSFYEGLGIVIIEAQTNGLPCIASDTIPKEAILTNLVYKVSLKESSETWAKSIFKSFHEFERRDRSNDIKLARYDIINTANLISDTYLEHH